MISAAQRMLGGMAPPRRSVHTLLLGQAPLAEDGLTPTQVYPAGKRVRKHRPRNTDDDVLLFVLR